MKLLRTYSLLQLMSFLCGQYRHDTDTSILDALFDNLAARNEYCIRGFYLPAPSISTPEGSEGKTKIPRGVLQDFVTSLQCLSECPARQDMAETIAQTLPQRLNVTKFIILNIVIAQNVLPHLRNVWS